MWDCPCSCMRCRPRCPPAVHRMSRGCGGCVGSVTQRGRWWDGTALQQRATQPHQSEARFEYCISGAPRTPPTSPKAPWSSSPALYPLFWGKAAWSLSWSWLDPSGADGAETRLCPGLEEATVFWLGSVCVCKCDNILCGYRSLTYFSGLTNLLSQNSTPNF